MMALDPDMALIVEICYRSHIIWSVDKAADRIGTTLEPCWRLSPREADPDDVVLWLGILGTFR